MEIWDGEIPRYDDFGRPINPDSVVTLPSNWPAIRGTMNKRGFDVAHTFEDTMVSSGEVTIEIWGFTRVSVETAQLAMFVLLENQTNWTQMSFGSGPNPPQAILGISKNWYSGSEENVRLAEGQLSYMASITYDVRIGGGTSTR